MLFGKRTQVVKRILVVEDEPLTAFENETLIESAGYEVVATRDSVADALATLDEHPVDLILADVKLSGKRSGIDLAREAARRGVPTLFATGHCPPEAAAVSIGCLMKPYSPGVLKDAIRAVEQHLEGLTPKLPKGLELFPLTAP
ncbi:MAG: response regulator [Sphingomicrobium sp.]